MNILFRKYSKYSYSLIFNFTSIRTIRTIRTRTVLRIRLGKLIWANGQRLPCHGSGDSMCVGGAPTRLELASGLRSRYAVQLTDGVRPNSCARGLVRWSAWVRRRAVRSLTCDQHAKGCACAAGQTDHEAHCRFGLESYQARCQAGPCVIGPEATRCSVV
jgi:hypothetical protein